MSIISVVMHRIFSFVIFFFFANTLFAQVLEFDKLEMRYDQKQYKAVYRGANKILDKPEYDYSSIPGYYLSLSKLQLAMQNKKWLKRNKNVIKEAHIYLEKMTKTTNGKEIFRSHRYEILEFVSSLEAWEIALKKEGDRTYSPQINALLKTVFEDFTTKSNNKPTTNTTVNKTYPPSSLEENKKRKEAYRDNISVPVSTDAASLTKRDKILHSSANLLGVPYKYSGMTPDGFDCSGFTKYIIDQELETNLDHNASGQYTQSIKIKREEAKPGDMVFFKQGKGIGHVGIIYSTDNESIQMIHSSTSKGISVVDIYESDYWRKRIVGFGTFIKG